MKSTVLRFLAVFLTATACVVGGSGSSWAQSARQEESVASPAAAAAAAIMAAQTPLDTARDKIGAVAHKQHHSGFAGTWVDAKRRTLMLYWHGALDPVSADTVMQLRQRGVRIMVKAAEFTEEQMNSAVHLIRTSPAFTSASIGRIRTTYDGSGVEIGVVGRPGLAPQMLSASVLALVPSMRLHTVTVRASQSYTREADAGNMWGGAVVISPPGSGGSFTICSAGFALVWPAIGKRYLVTAAHCGSIGTDWGNGQRVHIGTAEGTTSTANDGLFIHVAASGGAIYDGPGANYSGQFAKEVAGTSGNGPGDMLCVSGAITGAVCDIQISGNMWWDGSYHVWSANQLDGNIAAGQGDSGGPVFSLPNSTQVTARGIIHGGSGNSTCHSPYEGDYACSPDIEFTDINAIVSTFSGLQVQVGY